MFKHIYAIIDIRKKSMNNIWILTYTQPEKYFTGIL